MPSRLCIKDLDEEERRHCDEFTNVIGAPARDIADKNRTCPRCAGDGCDYCGGMGRLLIDDDETTP